VLPGYWGEHELREEEACTAEAKRWIVFLTLILPLESGLLPANLRILRKWCFIQFVRGTMWGECKESEEWKTLWKWFSCWKLVLPVKRFLTLFAAMFVLHLLLYLHYILSLEDFRCIARSCARITKGNYDKKGRKKEREKTRNWSIILYPSAWSRRDGEKETPLVSFQRCHGYLPICLTRKSRNWISSCPENTP